MTQQMKNEKGRMKKLIWFLISAFCLLPSAQAANWYIRTSSAGAANGTDWNNAWSIANLNANWSSVAGDDTIWIAGGTYTTSVHPLKSGTSGHNILFKRPLVSDGVPTSAAGWSAGFDSTVTINPASGDPWYYDNAALGSYMYVDGRTDQGIVLKLNEVGGQFYPGCLVFGDGAVGTHDITFTNIDCLGPFGSSSSGNPQSYDQSLTVRSWNGSSFNQIGPNITFANCRFHGSVNLNILVNATGFLFDHCKYYDNLVGNANFHQNMVEFLSSGNIRWHDCEFYNWAVEGIMPYGAASGPITIDGCVFHDAVSVGRVLEPFVSYQLFCYNNVFYNIPLGVYSSSGGGSWAAGSQARNNIYWSVSLGGLVPSDIDYEFSSGNVSGVHSITSGSNPFVNLAGADFHIISTIGAKFPRDKGATLASTYNTDRDGNTRGADGTWDMGAYEYPAAGGSPPAITSALTAGATNGIAFSYQITAAGSPTSFGASPRPSGLSVNGSSGLISGTPSDTPTTYNVTITATNGFGSDSKTLVITLSDPSATIGVISTNALYTTYTNGTQDRVFVVTNTAGAATLNGTASISAPWSVVGNATYALTTGNSTNITVRFSPTVVTNASGTLTFTGGGGTTVSLTGHGYPVYTEGATVQLTNVLFISPFLSSANYIYQNSEVSQPDQGGLALFGYNFTNDTTLTFSANLNAPNGASDSFWINVDTDPSNASDPTDPGQVWDVIPDTSGFEDRGVGWRGNGTFSSPQFPTNQWSVTTGIHPVYLRGREANAQIKTLTGIVPGGAPPADPPSAPLTPAIVSGNASNVFTWTAPASDGGASIGGYYVYRSTTSGAETYLATVVGALGYTNTSLANGTQYFYKVAATNSAGVGTLSGEVSGTPSTVPGAPTNVQISTWQSSIYIQWDTSSDGGSARLGSKIYRGLSTGTETQYAGLVQNNYYYDGGVTPSTAYYYKISDVNANGEGALSSEVNQIAPALATPKSRGRKGRR